MRYMAANLGSTLKHLKVCQNEEGWEVEFSGKDISAPPVEEGVREGFLNK